MRDREMRDTLIPMPLTLREVDLITYIRKIAFGIVEVHKKDSIILRLIVKSIEERKEINEQGGITSLQQEGVSIAFIGEHGNIISGSYEKEE